MVQWKSVLDWPYEISTTGLVRNVNTGRILRAWASGGRSGNVYSKVRLYDKKKKKDFYVHRLVALAFILRPTGQAYFHNGEVNHFDGNKWNNNVDNLGWMSRNENEKYRRAFEEGYEELLAELKKQDFCSGEVDEDSRGRGW